MVGKGGATRAAEDAPWAATLVEMLTFSMRSVCLVNFGSAPLGCPSPGLSGPPLLAAPPWRPLQTTTMVCNTFPEACVALEKMMQEKHVKLGADMQERIKLLKEKDFKDVAVAPQSQSEGSAPAAGT